MAEYENEPDALEQTKEGINYCMPGDHVALQMIYNNYVLHAQVIGISIFCCSGHTITKVSLCQRVFTVVFTEDSRQMPLILKISSVIVSSS